MIQLLFDAGPKYEPKYRNHCTSNRQCKFKYQLNKLNIRIKLKNSQNGHFHKSERCLVELDCNGYQQLFLFCPNILDDENDERTTDEFFWLMRFYTSMDEIQTFQPSVMMLLLKQKVKFTSFLQLTLKTIIIFPPKEYCYCRWYRCIVLNSDI